MRFIQQYQNLIAALVPILAPLLFALLRLTRWGKANQDALAKVAEAIEAVGDKQLKQDISAKFESAPQHQKDAMNQAVAIADPFKTPLSGYGLVLQDLSRLMMPKQKEEK